MRKRNFRGGFLYCLIINLGLNIVYSIPAWVSLVLHFWLNIPLWPFYVALGLWVAGTIFWMIVVKWARKCGDEPTPYRENKNPYSAKKYEIKTNQNNSDKNI